jgi:hypothetical protein
MIPKRVGHGGICNNASFDDAYGSLLEISKMDILNKSKLKGVGSYSVGKLNVQSLNSLYFRPSGINQNIEIPSSISLNNKNTLTTLHNDINKSILSYEECGINSAFNSNNQNFEFHNISNKCNSKLLLFLLSDKSHSLNQ